MLPKKMTTRGIIIFDVVVTLVLVVIQLVAMADISIHHLNLLVMASCPLFLLLMLAGLISISGPLINWREERFRSFLPIPVFACCLVGGIVTVKVGGDLIRQETPRAPETFFVDERRERLEEIAEFLLEEHFAGISFNLLDLDEKPQVVMQRGHAQMPLPDLPPDIEKTLREYRLSRALVDEENGMVVFSHYHARRRHNYIYLTDADAQLPMDEWDVRKSPRPLAKHWYYSAR